jgi:hypothetical protein
VSETSVGTGRLFRSLRAEGTAANAAVPALSIDQAVGLRSVTLGADLEYAEVAPRPEELQPHPAPSPGAAEAVADGSPSAEASSVAVAVAVDVAVDDESAGARRGAHAAPGVRSSGVWLIVIGVTVVMGFADALVVGRTGLGWLTGFSLLAASIYGAFIVRRQDAIVAVIAPPLAFFLATMTAGQLTLPPTGDLMVREAFMIVTTLGANAAWIFGSTIAALVIVLIRRRRG